MATMLIILTILFWGIGSYLGKIVLKEASSIHTYFLEATGTLTVAFLTVLFFKKEFIGILRSFNWAGYLFGLLWGLGTITFILALKLKPASVTVPLTALYPAVTAILAVVFLGETLTLRVGVGIILAVTSAFLLLCQ